MSRSYTLAFISILLFVSISFADYVDADARLYTLNGTNLSIRGYIRHDNNSGINYTNATGYLGNSNFTVFPNSSGIWGLGYYEFNVTSSNTTGRYNLSINVTLTNGTVIRENIEIRVGSLANATFNFTSRRPPFINGSYFELNISFSGRSNTEPNLSIFNPNGLVSTGWTIKNITNGVNTPSIIYNITVPTNADGRYVIIFDEGIGSTIFLVKSNVVVVAGIEDTSNSTTSTFGQGEAINIVGRIRDENNAIINANVTATITFPNGTVVRMNLTHSREVNGSYNGTFTSATSSGEYDIEIVANVSGKIYRSTSSAFVQQLEGKLDTIKDFFFDFGSQSAFQRNGNVEFSALVYNLSNDILLNGSTTTNSGADVNCTAIRVTELKNVLNGSLVSNPTLTKTTHLFLGQTVCKLRFTAPDTDGIYALTVNVSVGSNQTNNLSVLATGYFAVQSYILKPSPVSSLGGGTEFLTFLMPGDNATFELSVRNLSSNGTAVNGANITNFNVTKISPMDFTGGGQSEITSIQVIEYTSGTASTNPRIKLKLPENKTGPFQIEFQASVAGSVFRGTSFYFARYVEGFAFPSSFGGGFGTGAGDSEGGFGSSGGTFRCSGLQNFSARIFDVRTQQAAKNVVFNSIQEAREELTGKSVLSQLSISSSASTDSSGFGNITISFSGQFTGFYFMLINITTTDGKSDSLPAGFECRQLSYFPQIQAIGSTSGGGFFVAPTAGLNITISGIRNLNTGSSTQTGTVSIVKLESFDPSKGHKAIPGPTTLYTLVNGSVTFTLFPSNFTSLGGKWSSGFNDLRIQVCDNTTSTPLCDTSFGGFMVVAFDAFLDFSSGPPSTLTLGGNATYRIMARTNVTNFTAQIGLPWEGSLVDAAVDNYSKISDGWSDPRNNTDFNGFERWDVRLNISSTVRKGDNMVTIKVNNYLTETTDVITFATASRVSVSVPDTEGIFMTNYSVEANINDATNISNFRTQFKTDLSTLNLTFNGTYSKSGRVCARISFNTTRFGMSSQEIVYSSLLNTSVFLIDNATSGVYNVLVVNNSGKIAVATTSNRSLASAGLSGLYYVASPECGFVKIINTTINGTGFGAGYGGQHAINTIATIPIIVKQGNTPKNNVFTDVSQLIVQEDFGGGRGGFGFTELLPASDFTRTGAATDSNGIAFLRLNVSRSGSFSVIWNLSDSGDTDIAEFSQGIPIEIKSFVTSGGIVTGATTLPYRIVNLTRNTTEFTDANVVGAEKFIYAGTWNESLLGPLISDTITRTHTIILRNATENPPGRILEIPGGQFTELAIDNDNNFNTTQADSDGFLPVYGNWTAKFGPNEPSSRQLTFDTLSVDGNRTVNATLVQLLFSTPNTMFNTYLANPSNTTTVYANITVRACAETFAKPQTGLIGANVTNLTTRSFSFSGPPTIVKLELSDPFTGANVTSVLTGPSGCAVFNVTRVGGWKTGSPNEIKAKISTGGNPEDIYVGSISVACPSTGSCF